MEMNTNNDNSAPEKELPCATNDFRKILFDFTNDLNLVFPEYNFLWDKWIVKDLNEEELNHVFQYCMVFYPEKFFDILNKNDQIFNVENTETNVYFLPNVNFKILYNHTDITDTTKDNIWKYLQLILFSTVNSIQDSSYFGECLKSFDDIDTEDLRSKIDDTMKSLADMFEDMDNTMCNNNDETEEEVGDDADAGADAGVGGDADAGFGKKNAEQMFQHLNSLLNGKLGSLAKELAQDVSQEFNEEMLRGTGDMETDTKGMLKNMLSNPKKMVDLVKKVGGKLEDKIKCGDLSQEELMKEATDIMGKMKDMPGMENIQQMVKQLGKNMGSGGGVKLDTNRLNRMSQQEKTKERMRSKLNARKNNETAATMSTAGDVYHATEHDLDALAAEIDNITSGGGGKKKKSKKK